MQAGLYPPPQECGYEKTPVDPSATSGGGASGLKQGAEAWGKAVAGYEKTSHLSHTPYRRTRIRPTVGP